MNDPGTVRPAIEVEAVTKRFGSTQALAGVTLSVQRGEVVGLLGPNGAGKTTLVRVLSTLLLPDGGWATVGGHDVVRDARSVRAAIGLAGQSAALDELLTGRENLELVGRLYGLGRQERRRRAEEVLQRFGLTDAGGRLVRTYSGGMRRRLDLGATLVGRPSILMLDEPTAGLDPRSRNELWSFVEELAHEGTTILLTSQYLEEVERLAGKVVVIDHGRVIAEGSPDELKRQTGGDVLEAQLGSDGDLEAALALVLDLGDGTSQIDRDRCRISVPTAGGTRALVAAGRRLDDAGIGLTDLRIRRPSLDDVFFSLTGHAPGGPPGAAPAARPGVDDVRQRPSNPPARGDKHPANALRDMVALTTRYLRRFARTPQLLFFGTVQPVLFVIGLDAVFGGVVEQAAIILGRSIPDYIQYLLPGVLVMFVIIMAGTTGQGIAQDVEAGIVDRFRSLPITRSAVLVGRTVADLARNAASTAMILVVGLAMGFRFGGSAASAVAGVALVLLFGYAASWVFAAVGLAVKDPQTAQFLGFAPVLPLIFVSGAWIPVETMPDGVREFARNQPVNVTVEAVRSLVEGAPAYHSIWQSLAWSAGILVVFANVAVRQYRSATS